MSRVSCFFLTRSVLMKCVVCVGQHHRSVFSITCKTYHLFSQTHLNCDGKGEAENVLTLIKLL